MKSFFEKEEYLEEDLNQLINDGIEESTNLEFKAADALGRSEGKKKEIAKDVSAFANSDGGLIIYGMEENDHVASKLSFVDGNSFSKEWLEQIINTTIQRKINGLKIYPIRFEGKIEQTVYVVKIPASSLAPYMSKDKRYYRRYNFEVLQMEEYEVRNLFNLREKTELVIKDLRVIRAGSAKKSGIISYRNYNLECSIKNVSNSVEEYYKIQLAIPINVLAYEGDIIKYFDRSEDGLRYYSFPGSSPIFQNEVITMFKVKLKIDRGQLKIAEKEFNISLFYSNGVVKVTQSLKQTMYDNGIILSKNFT